MIVNIFTKTEKVEEKNNISKNKPENEVDIKKLQKYAIDNGLEYLKNGSKEPIIKMLQEFITFNYSNIESEKMNYYISKVLDDMFGYGILQKYIEKDKVSDIRVVRYDLIYIKELGKWKKVKESFKDEEELLEYIRYTVIKNNSNINFDVPIIVVSDKKYNLRIEAGILPVNSVSPSLVIRIHRKTKWTLDTIYKKQKMLDKEAYDLIKTAIKNDSNIIISGKGGSGKTTLLKCIINEISDEKAITINEETAELFTEGKNIIQREILENRNENKKIDLNRLMRHSLVMSNDVIVVGEIKGKEMTTFLDAICTGHIGLATVHSDNAYNTINRLITLFKRDSNAQQYKEEFIENILTSSIDYIVFMKEYKVFQIAKHEYSKTSKKYKFNIIYERKEN